MKQPFLALAFAIALVGCSDVDTEAQPAIRRGDQIVVALEAYRQKRGEYPAALEDLAPDFLDKPQLRELDGVEIEYYYARSLAGYKLGFFYGPRISCSLNSHGGVGEWVCSDPL
jgi:hypothetical protein